MFRHYCGFYNHLDYTWTMQLESAVDEFLLKDRLWFSSDIR